MRPLVTIGILLCCASVAAQQGPPNGERRGQGRKLNALDVLADIRIEGEDELVESFSTSRIPAQLLGATVTSVSAISPPEGFDPASDSDIPLGVELSEKVIRKALSHMWSTGNYRAIEISVEPAAMDGEASVLIEVEPMLRLAEVKVNGNKALSSDEIEQSIDYRADGTISPTKDTLVAFKDAIMAAYAERGFREAKAKLRIETTPRPGKVALIIDITEGRPDRYGSISIPGLPEELNQARVVRSIGLRRRMIRDRAKVEKVTDDLLAELANFGWLDAKALPASERRTGKYSISLELPVDPGIRTKVTFEGNRRMRQRDLEEYLHSQGPLQSSPSSIGTSVARLRTLYLERGLFFARIGAKRICTVKGGKKREIAISHVCPATTSAQEVVFSIQEGPPVQVAGIEVEGNVHFSDEDISSEVLAFMLERNQPEETTQPINTRTLDGGGRNQPGSRTLPSKGAITPTVPPARAYVPKHYLEAMEHLVSLYQEEGFLSASVVDTCDVKNASRPLRNGIAYKPLLIDRVSSDEDAQVDAPCLFVEETLTGLVVRVTVEEGPQTLLKDLRVEGNDPSVMTEKAILGSAGLKSGQPFNEYRLEEAASDMRKAYRRRGYAFVHIEKKVSLSSDGRTADTVFTVEEGPRVTIDKIIVRGNAKTRTYLITDRIRLETGDLVTPEGLSQSERLLMELGLFESVTVSMASPEIPAAKKHLIIQVTEVKNNYVDFRLGLASVEGVRGLVEYGYRNIGGMGINARIRGRANYRLFFPGKELDSFEARYSGMSVVEQLERHILLGLETPHVMGTGGLLGTGFNLTHERTNHSAFSVDNFLNGYLTLKSNYLRVLPIEARTGVEWSRVELTSSADEIKTNPRFTRWSRMPEGDSLFWVTGLSISLDLRDDYFNPSEGFVATVSGDLVRSLANFEPVGVTDDDGNPVVDPETGEQQTIDRLSNLIRAKATISGYIPLIDKDLVLALSTSLGYVFHLQEDSTTWADRYFYMGGVGTLRGFFKDSVVPEDVYQDWKNQVRDYSEEADALLDARGGETMFLLRAELKFPIAGSFRGGVFAEAGNVWRSRGNLSLNPLDLRPTAGLGLRYMTPVGPIAFDLGFNLDKRPHEDWAAWFFSIGSAF